MISLDEIVHVVRAKPAPDGVAPKIIAVDGPGGAGKSTLASHIADRLGGAPVLRTDDFASWDNPVDWWPRLIAEALEPLSRNRAARFRRADWEDADRELWTLVEPAEYLVLEGVSASREAFRPYLTLSIWVETPRDVRLARGLARDGDAARGQWERWMAQEDDYIARENPRERADFVVPGDREES